jgi:RNA polymerase sigma-70 factor (ECF subfamily)
MANDLGTPDDAEIVRQILSGNLSAFDQLLDKYQKHVLRIVTKHIPPGHLEDAMQEVFINVFQSLPTFRGDSGLSHWISTVAVRTCYKFWRNHYKSPEQPMSSLAEKHRVWLEETLSEESDPSFSQKILEEEARKVLDWGLDKLSAEDRMVLELVYLEGHSVKEAARLLGWTIVNVKVRSFRARRKLHRELCKPLQGRRRGT